MLAVGLVLLCVAGVAAGAVAAVSARARSGSDSGTGAPGTYPAQDRPGPVLLVPGYGGSTGSLSALAAKIRATGRQATVLSLPGNGTGDLNIDAGLLDAAVNRALRGGAPSVDVIGYSAGGVVALLWARGYDGARKARRVITLGSPFHGASIAAVAEGLVPGACPVACQQLAPGSSLLAPLDAGSISGHPRWTSLWTTDDTTVTPPDSARLSGAINVPVQSVCPGEQITHSQLPVNPVATAIVLTAIGPGPLGYPTSAACHG